ncbi:hypothetical protein B0H15DRAFT_768403, partial [Mycena belliarum]
QALALLRAALSEPYPSGKGTAPLNFNLEVVEGTPTADQLSSIITYLPSKSDVSPSPASLFLSAHPASMSAEGGTLAEVAKIGADKPKIFKWPIVVDWNAGKASVGDVDGVKGILEHLRQKRDGETGN